ncbi:hypothetical protein BUY43_03320 [Staphylococcus devriesei]|uniref:Uncharacterized protein n=1 Tax=Staphylococcus devriesei TaxID=586733 RepID=A0A2T4KYS4_9STAP|nr:hypothetical protein [Staphylococcus devriesei]MCE5090498.1 hypothetical protein [Staphylococcus devriesei]MCE5096624.1 hypothetical protein [Staphylococcus devriesei]PTE73159.1 hypothetical protein BUY44_07075 [Staphylococcus devriesei]PTF02181.1 hypothetical protein BUY45_10525 [Staphylococcus devriesei]PTF14288.1 hypothetical protein BUY48_07635 [Staphylococcus devriesei]
MPKNISEKITEDEKIPQSKLKEMMLYNDNNDDQHTFKFDLILILIIFIPTIILLLIYFN